MFRCLKLADKQKCFLEHLYTYTSGTFKFKPFTFQLRKIFIWDFKDKAIVASLQLKNERGERLSSHRSDHVTGVWGGLHNLYNVQRIFFSLGCSTSSTLFPTLPPLHSNYNAFLLNMQVILQPLHKCFSSNLML